MGHADRAHAVLSASSAHRWLKCPASAIACASYPSTQTAYTEEGTRAHEVAEAYARYVLQNGPVPPVCDDEDMLRHARGYADFIQEQISSHEDVVLLEQKVDFSEYVPEGFGTADCIIVKDGELVVIDYKYGQGVKVDANNNHQMQLYALGAYLLLRDLYDFDSVTMHIYQPRLDSISTSTIPVSALLTWASEFVKPTAEQIMGGRPKYEAGEHCRFCQHAGKCKKLSDTCSRTVELYGKSRKVTDLAPFEVSMILDRSDMITAWLKAVKAQAQADILSGKEVPGYKVVEGKQGNRKWLDDSQVCKTLESAGVSPMDYLKTELKSPSEMDKTIGKKKVSEILSDLITRSPGAPTIVSASDKRPALNKQDEARKDFE